MSNDYAARFGILPSGDGKRDRDCHTEPFLRDWKMCLNKHNAGNPPRHATEDISRYLVEFYRLGAFG